MPTFDPKVWRDIFAQQSTSGLAGLQSQRSEYERAWNALQNIHGANANASAQNTLIDPDISFDVITDSHIHRDGTIITHEEVSAAGSPIKAYHKKKAIAEQQAKSAVFANKPLPEYAEVEPLDKFLRDVDERAAARTHSDSSRKTLNSEAAYFGWKR